MPKTPTSLLPYHQQAQARQSAPQDLLLAGYICPFEQTIDYNRLKRDYSEVEFIGLVGFDRQRQQFVLLKIGQEPEDSRVGASLSEREREVLQLVALGCTNFQIARKLAIAENTVKAHLQNIFAKLKVQSRTEAAMHAAQRGWVTG